MNLDTPPGAHMAENSRVMGELLLSQLKQHDESINRLETKLDMRMDEIRDRIQKIVESQTNMAAGMGERLTRLETRMDQVDAKSGDGRWIVTTIVSILSLFLTIIYNFLVHK